MKPSYTLQVPQLEESIRLDQFLVQHFPKSSRAYWKKHLEDTVRIDQRKPSKGERVQGGESLFFLKEPPQAAPKLRANSQLKIKILYEDADLLAVEKAAGMSCYPLNEEEADTLANGLVAQFPELAASAEKPLEAGLLQRLDYETSGVLLVARHPTCRTLLNEMTRQKSVRKYYLALVKGRLEGRGKIDFPIYHNPKNKKKMCVLQDPFHKAKQLQNARTEYRCIRSTDAASWLLLTIHQGVRHQIRVHLAALGHPIWGDKLYDTEQSETRHESSSLNRHMLHARSISFLHPISKKRYRVKSEIPKDFKEELRRLGFSLKDRAY